MTDSSKILRPLPQRNWQATPRSITPPTPATPADSQMDEKSTPSSMSRTRSILNLTSSTLFGIYKDGLDSVPQSVPGTPWGAMTPLPPSSPVFGEERSSSVDGRIELPTKRAFQKRKPVDFVVRTILLFCTGFGYGMFISHIHDNPHITPIKLEGMNRTSWSYLVSWGITGAVAGNLLPWLEDIFKEEEFEPTEKTSQGGKDGKQSSNRSMSVRDWSQPLRGIGVFIGIAYAIVSGMYLMKYITNKSKRRLPWESSSQAALTLALANPGLWFLVDRSRVGLGIATVLAVVGTPVLLGLSPDLIPQPAGGADSKLTAIERIQAHGLYSTETVGVFIWLASVIFCTCICFRSIGKRLVGLIEDT